MGNTFDVVGVAVKASSGRSLKLELHLPDGVFETVCYVGIKSLQEVLDGRNKTATIWILKKDS